MAPFWSSTRRPQKPEAKLASLTVSVHAVGSVVEVTQTLAANVVPTTLNRSEYGVFAVAVKALEARFV